MHQRPAMQEHRDDSRDCRGTSIPQASEHQRPDQAPPASHRQHRSAAAEDDPDRRVGDAQQYVSHRGHPARASSPAADNSSFRMKPRARLAPSRDPYAAGLRLDVSTTTGRMVSVAHDRLADREPVDVGQRDVQQDDVGAEPGARRRRPRSRCRPHR